MRPTARRIPVATALAAALATALPAHAVRTEADDLGQALIYPYYSARTAFGSPLNTYISVVNHAADVKALRVRFREGRTGAETLSFNLFLSPNDVWTGAVFPSGDGTRLATADDSCTDPVFVAGSGGVAFLDFSAAGFNDGAGTGLDRTGEGFVEVIEMARLDGESARGATHTSAGSPFNCGAVRGAAVVSVAAPSGGLSGGATLINVANGMNFTVPAVALADLSTRPFYRVATDPYPAFNAAEIDPVSVVLANGALYRSVWSRPVDAVSAALMRSGFAGEYVLDRVTASRTELVVTFPTRHHYVTATAATAPFQGRGGSGSHCSPPGGRIGDAARLRPFNHEAQTQQDGAFGFPVTTNYFCGDVVPFDVENATPVPASSDPTRLLGSTLQSLGSDAQSDTGNHLLLPENFEHGWIKASFSEVPTLTSLPASTRTDLATGAVTTGAHAFSGLPFLGFSARTFTNGTLSCGAATCQGNYGGAFPLQYRRTITP